jgi:hypothetical protein
MGSIIAKTAAKTVTSKKAADINRCGNVIPLIYIISDRTTFKGSDSVRIAFSEKKIIEKESL